MGYLYLLRRRLATLADQMMKPEMTSSTASRVVTTMESEPLTAAIASRTISSTLRATQRHHVRRGTCAGDSMQRHKGGCGAWLHV